MKNLSIHSLILLIFFLSVSCKDKEVVEDKMTGIIVQKNVNIRVKNSSGVDLLDPNNENSIKNFKVYYLINGEKQLYNQPLLDNSAGYKLLQHPTGGYYYLQVLMDGSKGILETTTFLQLGSDNALDTIKTLYKSDPNNIILQNIWYNSNLVWKAEDGEPTFEIIKP